MGAISSIRSAVLAVRATSSPSAIAKSFSEGRLYPRDYARCMAQLWNIYCALERGVLQDRSVAVQYPSRLQASPLIQRDITGLGFELSEFPRLEPTSNLVNTIGQWSRSAPISLLPSIYVLEASRFAASISLKQLRKALGLSSERATGVEYFLACRDPKQVGLAQLERAIEEHSAKEEMKQFLVTRARHFAQSLEAILASTPVTARSINPSVRAPELQIASPHSASIEPQSV